MKAILKNHAALLISVSFVTACGGSGGSDTSSPASVSPDILAGDEITLAVTPQSDNDSADIENGSQGDEVALSNETGVAEDSAIAVELPVPAEPVAEDPADTGTGQATNSGSSDSDDASAGNNGTDEVVSSAVFPNSVCVEPGSSSVSFEPYSAPRNGGLQNGVYVPFPASGFGWNGEQLCDLEGSRELDEIEVLVPYVAIRPDIDGKIARDEWLRAANASTINYETLGNDIENLLRSPVSRYLDGAGYSEWWAMHDGTNLYLRIRVTNDASSSSSFFDSEMPWHDDSVELYIDGDNSKGESYDGVNDFQVFVSADNYVLPYFAPSSAPGMRIFHKSTGGSLYNIEVAINLESVGIKIGKPFGFDVHINEDDNGGDRDAKWGWFEKTGFDRSWFQPSAFGTLLLTDCENRQQCGSYQSLLP